MFPLIKKIFVKRKENMSTLETVDSGSLYFCKIAIYTGADTSVLSHIKLWAPILSKNNDICIITRKKSAYNICKKNFDEINIVYAKGADDLENIINNLNLKIIFYTSNASTNIHMCRFTHLKHIFLGHGDSNKSGSANNIFKMYDEVWVSGQAHIDRFSKMNINMSGTKLKIIGMPQLNYIHKVFNPNESFIYLPTWEGSFQEHAYSSLPISHQLFCNNKLQKLAIKIHPSTGIKNKKYDKYFVNTINLCKKNNIELQIYPKDINVLDILPEHYGYICDNSATVSAALYFDKPMFIYQPYGVKYANSKIQYSEFSYVFSNVDQFNECINNYYNDGDIFKEKRTSSIDYFISRDATRNNYFQKNIDEILNN